MYFRAFLVKLDRCNEICNTIDDLSSRIGVPNKVEDENLNLFNMIIRINESETLRKTCFM